LAEHKPAISDLVADRHSNVGLAGPALFISAGAFDRGHKEGAPMLGPPKVRGNTVPAE